MKPCPYCDGPFNYKYADSIKLQPTCWTCHGTGYALEAAANQPVKVTPANLQRLVKNIDLTESKFDNTVRMRLTLVNGEVFGFVIAMQVYHAHPGELEQMVILELNRYFAKEGQDPKYAEILKGKQEQLGWSMGGEFPDAYPPGFPVPAWQSFWKKPAKQAVGGGTIVRDLRKLLPGLDERVQCPGRYAGGPGRWDHEHERCGLHSPLRDMIIHLNDSSHRWTREDLADWLESLDIDLTFPTDVENLPEPPEPEPTAEASWGSSQTISDMKNAMKEVYAKQMEWHAAASPLLDYVKVQFKAANSDLVYGGYSHGHGVSGPSPSLGLYDELANTAPPSPLEAKKAHALQQQELLEKLNKPKKKGGN